MKFLRAMKKLKIKKQIIAAVMTCVLGIGGIYSVHASVINDAKNNSDIYFSKGKYYLNSMIIDKNIRIIGENKTNTILIANSTSSIFTINKKSLIDSDKEE